MRYGLRSSRYHVEVVSIQAELVVELAPGDFCGNDLPFGWKARYPTTPTSEVPGRLPPEVQVPLSGMAAA
ncbi:MAG: hypothetical protein IPN20_13025 [Haliscomenobacter sp.]|nr:hypothetical protein [Haliscomenobacter sp.]